MKKIRVGVIGATGYTGEELVRILSRHPRAELSYVSGKEDREAKIQEIFPCLSGSVDLACRAFSFEEAVGRLDVAILSLPHTVSMKVAPDFLKAGKKVVDVSADYRLSDPETYERFYRTPHVDPANLRHAVYGLPEANRAKIRKAKLVANPGCYPTGAILGLLPGVSRGVFDASDIVIDAKSGVTGAGRKADKSLNFSEVNESFKAYKVFEHPHLPEINQELGRASRRKVSVVFVPHLLPVNRGILSTMYVRTKKIMTTDALTALYRDFYAGEPFVHVYEKGLLPELKHAAYTNRCGIGLRAHPDRRLAVVVTAIDNLVKGAAGQAVQNLNLMCGFGEKDGLL